MTNIRTQTLTEADALGTKRKEVLAEADRIIHGERQCYGSPTSNLTVIARMWSAYIGHKIEAQDVGMMMILLKAARFKNSPLNMDHVVDIAGYAALTGEVVNVETDDGVQEKMEE